MSLTAVVAFGGNALGVLVEGQREITRYGGWRAYVEAEGISS